jgi:osmotically-inducible protein OsmY
VTSWRRFDEADVELRGRCADTDQIVALEAEVRKVSGVIDVHNYLHVPGTTAPNKQGSGGS